MDERGYPRNPRGRTGMRDRGLLGKWGPNHAADPIVTRFHPRTRVPQMVAIKRRDTNDWAIPGGMVEDGMENVSHNAYREFTEEAGNIKDPEKKALFESLTAELFRSGTEVYRGYVDDPRNTDNSWMETTAFHFHCSEKLAQQLPLSAGDDAVKAKWLTINTNDPDYQHLYASHRDCMRASCTWNQDLANCLTKSSGGNSSCLAVRLAVGRGRQDCPRAAHEACKLW